MIKRATDLHIQIETAKESVGAEKFEEMKKKARENLKSTQRVEQVAQAKASFTQALSVPYVPNAMEHAKGVRTAAMVEGKLQFGKIHGNKGNNLALLRREWKERLRTRLQDAGEGAVSEEIISEQDRHGIKELRSLIREDEKERRGPLSDEESKYFMPLYTACDDYTWDLVK